MPNGFCESKEIWDSVEAPLIELDPILVQYAHEHNLAIDQNYHNWPGRTLEWSDNNINRKIQIYLGDEKKLLFNLWIVAWQDLEGKRYWKNDFLKKEALITEIKSNLRELLCRARTTVNSWQSSDLEFAAHLKVF